MARASYRARRIRDTVFKEEDLFGEPAWDMLLDLACAETSGERLSVSSACIGSCAPPTTGLRWLAVLEKRGLVEREEDQFDKRRVYVRLSPKGISKLKEYFRATRTP
ncbi:MAG: winged helix DNA-binding protein [Novosphingobium sp.]|nr:winged helix DNA-binding protein [Novosphingobium sp.]